MDSSTSAAVCLAQTLTTSARLVKFNLTDGRAEPLDGLWNPVETIGTRFKEIFIRNRYGQVSDGFLALPRSDKSRREAANITYPLAVMLYGFDRSFAKNGQWIKAYPVDRLVRAGIAVLLLNLPEEFNWRMGDSSTVRFELLSAPLSTVLMAPVAVRALGARIGKVMVLGWSWGGLLAAHAVEKSCEFVAAEIGDPPAWNEAEFALGNASWRYWNNWYFGGPPNDKYIGNYLTFDPMHSGAPPNSPILFEFVSRNLSAGQYLEEWRAAGAYVEAFGYHRSEHYLNVSAEASMSRERNLAWAKINLLGASSVSGRTLVRLGLSVPPSVRCRQAQVRELQ
jgi:hypothetical protein